MLGTGFYGFDPLFVDLSGFDDSLLPGSSAIDMGEGAALPTDFMDTAELLLLDFAGLDRFFDDPDTVDTGPSDPPVVDTGAFEFQPIDSSCLADLTGDGTLNFFDISAFLGAFAVQGTHNGWGHADKIMMRMN